MMEALTNDTICTSDSTHSLSRINPHSVDELSREKEEELLYGAGDDCDEEDALSDDSIRLRLSDDDEIETNETLASTLDIQEYKKSVNEIEETPRKDEDLETSSILENSVPQDKSKIEEISEEQCTGNVTTGENIIVNEKTPKKYENEMDKQKLTNMHRPRQNIDPRWRLSNSDGLRFNYDDPHNYNNFQESYRSVNSYNNRLNCSFPHRRGRMNYYLDNRQMYNNRPQQRRSSLKQAFMNNSAEHGQNVTSLSNTNVSLKPTVSKDISNKEINDSKLINKDDMLNSQSSVSSNENNQSNLKALKNDIEVTNSSEDCPIDIKLNDNSAISLSKIECNLEVNSEVKVSNTGKCQDVTTNEICTLENNDSEKIENSLDTDDITNTDKIDQNETTEQSISNQKQDEITETTDASRNENKEDEGMEFEDEEDGSNHMLTDTSQKTTLPKDNLVASCELTEKPKVVHIESLISEELMDNKKEEVKKNIEDEVLLERSECNEDCKNDTPEESKAPSTPNSVNDSESNEIEIIQNGESEEPDINNEKCNNNALNEDDSNNLIEKLKDQQTNLNLREENRDIVEENVEICTGKENSALISLEVSKTTNLNNECSGNTALNENDSKSNMKPQNNSLDIIIETNNDNSDSIKRSAELPIRTQKKRRRTKKMIASTQEADSEEYKQVSESRRQKRQTAKNAEEIIRKKFLNYDSDLESSDSSEKFVAVNYNKITPDARSLSPPSLKRSFTDDSAAINGNLKKLKISSEVSSNESETNENSVENIKKLTFIEKFFRRDINGKLKKLTQEELEELLIQKFVETITMRNEIGTLREQAQTSNRNLEAMRTRCQQLAKQVKDFEMVLNRNAADRRANNDKLVPPIKINRSVGLQVNFMTTDQGMQNLRQLQQNTGVRILQTSSINNNPTTSNNETNTTSNLRRGIKVRSPRMNESGSGPTPTVSQSPTQSPNVATVTPAALVVAAKPAEAQHSLTLPNQASIQQILPNQQSPSKSQNIVVNGKLPNPINRQNSTPTNTSKPRTNDLIDLTDEEEKSKATSVPTTIATTITEQQINLAQKTQQSCFQRVIQAIPNVSITNQPPPNLRVVHPSSQPTPTALVNNMNAPRLTYVMQSGVGPTRQLLIAQQNTAQIRPVVTCRTPYPTVTYKGISTIANGTVRVLTTTAATPVQIKHPAPLPDIRSYAPSPSWKLPPPAPSLKISKVAHGIVLSWNMTLSDKYAEIVSYQLYAYQEMAGVPPNTSLWKKVGDVRALPLPMACTLTQFSEGNTYYFAVRGVDTHSRKGQYSIPGNITL